jgi:SiaC family regulatory phosphoprotein
LGNLQITGESFPEDAPGYFRPIIDWLNDYAQSEYVVDPHNQTIFMSNIEYFNTGSRPFVMEMVKILNDLYTRGHKVHFKWFYDGEIGIEEDDIHFEDLIEDFVLSVDYIPRLVK